MEYKGSYDPTNSTIVWNGNGVSDGKLVTASAGDYTVTATIANGASESSSYTKNFSIKAYDPGTSTDNPFGQDATPYVWALEEWYTSP